MRFLDETNNQEVIILSKADLYTEAVKETDIIRQVAVNKVGS